MKLIIICLLLSVVKKQLSIHEYRNPTIETIQQHGFFQKLYKNIFVIKYQHFDINTIYLTAMEKYRPICKLGTGSFGQVYKVLRITDHQFFAMKQIHLANMPLKDINNSLNQIRILASQCCKFVIAFEQAFYDQKSKSICVIMELAQKGDLQRLIKKCSISRQRIPQKQIWKALYQISLGIYSLHLKNIIHRDIKSANIFLSQSGQYKVGDLNVSKVIQTGFAKTQVGTPYYTPPQIWSQQPYTSKCDMWSLGCLIYEMAALKPPFTGTTIEGLYKKVIVGYYDPIPRIYSQQLSQIIYILLKKQPEKRPNIVQLLNMQAIRKRFDTNNINQLVNLQCKMLDTLRINLNDMEKLKKILPQYKSHKHISTEGDKIESQQLINNFLIDQSQQVRNKKLISIEQKQNKMVCINGNANKQQEKCSIQVKQKLFVCRSRKAIKIYSLQKQKKNNSLDKDLNNVYIPKSLEKNHKKQSRYSNEQKDKNFGLKNQYSQKRQDKMIIGHLYGGQCQFPHSPRLEQYRNNRIYLRKKNKSRSNSKCSRQSQSQRKSNKKVPIFPKKGRILKPIKSKKSIPQKPINNNISEIYCNKIMANQQNIIPQIQKMILRHPNQISINCIKPQEPIVQRPKESRKNIRRYQSLKKIWCISPDKN